MMVFGALLSALALQLPVEPTPPVTLWTTGSLHRSSTLHVGVRPAALATNDGPEWGIGVTAQISVVTPW
jgi:hypothetical protein